MKADSAWQLDGGKEKTSAAEVEGRPGDLSSRTFCERRFTEATTACAYKREQNQMELSGN